MMDGRSSSGSSFYSRQGGGDRFIPNRSAMVLDIAHYLLTAAPRKERTIPEYHRQEKEPTGRFLTVLFCRTELGYLFNSRPTEEMSPALSIGSPSNHKRYVSRLAERVLEAPNIVDDFYLNLLNWGKRNILAIALGNSVYLWNDSVRSASKFLTVDDDIGPVSSVSWALDGQHVSFGLSNSQVQLWDVTSNRPLRTLEGIHRSRVGSLAWNGDILTTGGRDGNIVNNDVRIRSHIVQKYKGHRMEVCGLKWSGSGNKLANGGNDDLVHIWDCSMAVSNTASNKSQWLHRFEEHTGAIKALAWCPFQRNLLASGGGESDRCIRFWNTDTGDCLRAVNTRSQVCGLIWSKNEQELLSSHGLPQNNLALWRYPYMKRIVELNGHSTRVLTMVQSPDGCSVVSAAGDETLRFWKIYETSTVEKVKDVAPFASFSRFTTIR